MLPGLCYNGRMQLYRVLGYWYFEITADRQDGTVLGDPAWPGPVPFVPLGIPEEGFNAYIRYVSRVAYFSFGEMWDSLPMWAAWAQSSINGQVQWRPAYKWVPVHTYMAVPLFGTAGVRKFVNPRFGPETLEEVEPHTILATYEERAWLYRQEWYGRTGYNKFEEVGELGDILMFTSRDPRWGRGHPDRMFTALRYGEMIEDVPRLVFRYWTKIAAIYLGKGYKGSDGVYYLTGRYSHRANLRAPTGTWLGW